MINQAQDGLELKHGGDSINVEDYVRGENLEDFTKTHEDGKSYAKFSDMLYAGLKSYAELICSQIPEPLLGKEANDTEYKSVAAGIKAMDACVKQLKKDLSGAVIVTPDSLDETITDLPGWYADAFTEFLSWGLANPPEAFKGLSNKARARQAITACELIKADLVKGLVI